MHIPPIEYELHGLNGRLSRGYTLGQLPLYNNLVLKSRDFFAETGYMQELPILDI